MLCIVIKLFKTMISTDRLCLFDVFTSQGLDVFLTLCIYVVMSLKWCPFIVKSNAFCCCVYLLLCFFVVFPSDPFNFFHCQFVFLSTCILSICFLSIFFVNLFTYQFIFLSICFSVNLFCFLIYFLSIFFFSLVFVLQMYMWGSWTKCHERCLPISTTNGNSNDFSTKSGWQHY